MLCLVYRRVAGHNCQRIVLKSIFVFVVRSISEECILNDCKNEKNYRQPGHNTSFSSLLPSATRNFCGFILVDHNIISGVHVECFYNRGEDTPTVTTC